jgi:WD40 repeat protein
VKDSEFKYYAFISYSHRDSRWANWLHRKLETYHVPKLLTDRKRRAGDELPERIYPVFRDREELPTSSELNDQIVASLRQSRFLLVICSPRSAQSRWVNEEIMIYKRLGRDRRILSLIVDGEPNVGDKPELEAEECFPPALRYVLNEDGKLSDHRTEPIAADARPGKDGKSDALLKVIAGLLGVGFDDLKQRELHRKHRRMLAITLLALSLTLLTSTLAVTAVLSRRDAERQRTNAIRTLAQSEFLQGTRLIEEDRVADGMAHLARSIRVDPSNREAADALLANLMYRTWPMPLGAPQTWDGTGGRQVNLSADGQLLVATAGTDTIRVYDRQSAALLAEIDETGGPFSLTLHPELDLLAVGGRSGKFRIFEPRSGEALTPWFGLKRAVGIFDQRFSTDGSWFAAAAAPAGFFIWPVRENPGPPTHLDQPLDTVMFSRNDETVFTANTNLAQVWEFENGHLTERINDEINVAAPVGKVVLLGDDAAEAVVATWRGELAVWDMDVGESFGDPVSFPEKINDLVLSDDETSLLVASGKELRLLSTASLRPLSEPAIHHHEVVVARFLGDTRIGLSVAADGSDRLITQQWDFRPGLPAPDEFKFATRIDAAAFGGTSSRFIIRGEDRISYAFEVAASGEVSQLAYFGGELLKSKLAVLSPSGERLIDVAPNNLMTLYQLAGGELVAQPMKARGTVSAAAFSADDARLFLGYTDGQAEIRDGRSGEEAMDGFPLGNAAGIAAFDSGGSRLAVTTTAEDVQIWQLGGENETPRRVAQIVFESQVNGVVFDRDGRTLACATGAVGEAGEVHFLDAASGQAVAAVLPITSGAHSVALNRSGERVAVASYDGTVCVWDIESGVALTPPLRPGEPALAIRFVDDDSSLQTLSTAGKFHRWPLPVTDDAPAPSWLADFAEGVCFRALDDRGVLGTLGEGDFAARKKSLFARGDGDPLVAWAKWILEDRESRPPHSPTR